MLDIQLSMQEKMTSRLCARFLPMRRGRTANASPWRRPSLGSFIVTLLLGGLPVGLCAQNTPSPGSGALPPVSKTAQVESSASIAGTVKDSSGAAIPVLPVTLAGQNNAINRVTATDTQGAFLFTDLPAGSYLIKIHAASLEPFVSAPVVLTAGERRALPIVATRMPKQVTTVHVVATLKDVAQAQVKEEEQQRVLGFLPNYYTSYIWNAAPLTTGQKFGLAVRATIDPLTFVTAAGVAGVEQWHNTFPGYGQGSEGYAKRYGASYADTVANRMLGTAIFPTLFHQDPRYFYRGSGSVRSRILYALASTVICRGDNGRLEPNYSQVLGNFTTAGLSNLYRAPGDRKAGLTFRNGLIITGSGAVVNLLREFLSRKLTPNVPAFANGKP